VTGSGTDGGGPEGGGGSGAGPILVTDRLVLRRWQPEDRDPFAALNADAETMRYFPTPLTRAASDELADRIEEGFAARGYGLWAVEVPGQVPFAGFVGLSPATFDAPFTPTVEIGWRLARSCWGRGYATEAARAGLEFGFDDLGLTEIVSFTTFGNQRSRAVMARLGMVRDPDGDFDHPALPVGHPLRRHVLYRLARGDRPSAPT